MEHVREFTEATRAEPANLWFDWSRSVDDPNEWVLVEAFDDDGAEPHVTSDHFRAAIEQLPQALAETPASSTRPSRARGSGRAWPRCRSTDSPSGFGAA